MKQNLTLTIDSATYVRLYKLAEQERRSMSNMASIVLDRGLDAYDKEGREDK